MEQETKRDRVRRLVLTPLAEAGFRFPRGTSDDAGTASAAAGVAAGGASNGMADASVTMPP